MLKINLTRQFGIFALLIYLCFGSTSVVLAQQDPVDLIKQISRNVLTELNSEQTKELLKTNPDAANSIVDRLLVPHADFNEMSRRVLGLQWRNASAEQREAFQKVFSELVVRTYSTALKDYKNQQIDFPVDKPRYNSSKNLAEVRSVIKEPGKADTPVNYRLVLRNEGWLVYDIIIEGVSLVNSYRTQFTEPIRRDGLDKVIQDIREKNAKQHNKKS